MNWDQIESKWAAMTCRVRADWTADRLAALAPVGRRAPLIDLKRDLIGEPTLPLPADIRQTMPSE